MSEKLTLKTGLTKNKRTITIWDEDFKIDITAWEEQTASLDLTEGQIVLFQNLQFKEYQRIKQLIFNRDSKVNVNIPDIPRYKEMITLKLSSRNDEDMQNLSS